MSLSYQLKDYADIFSPVLRSGYSLLCIYGSDSIPEGSIRSNNIHFCISNAIVHLALNDDVDSIHFGPDVKKGACPGSRAWLGYEPFNPFLKYFVSTGYKKFPAEFLSKNPEISEKKLKSLGRIDPLGKYTIIRKCESIGPDEDIDIRAFLLFGKAEEIRNLSMLIYFESEGCFNKIQVPWGSSCGSFITYPAYLAENVPKDCVFLGPLDPTDNYFFPPDILSMGIPAEMMDSIVSNLPHSFIAKRPKVAFPEKRINPVEFFNREKLKEFSHNLFSHR